MLQRNSKHTFQVQYHSFEIYEITWKNNVFIALGIQHCMLLTQGYKYTHSVCVITFTFLLQQWLHECSSMLRCQSYYSLYLEVKPHKNNLLYIICILNPTEIVTILMEEISISSGSVLKVRSKRTKCCRLEQVQECPNSSTKSYGCSGKYKNVQYLSYIYVIHPGTLFNISGCVNFTCNTV